MYWSIEWCVWIRPQRLPDLWRYVFTFWGTRYCDCRCLAVTSASCHCSFLQCKSAQQKCLDLPVGKYADSMSICSKNKIECRRRCRRVWRDIKWSPPVCSRPVNLGGTRTRSSQPSNQNARWSSVPFSHVVVLNEEEAGDDSFQRVYMQFKVTLALRKRTGQRLKMTRFFSNALAATHRISLGI